MKAFITCLLLGALLGIIPSPLPAQQNQNQEIEALKKQVSELEKQLQIVENIEKLDLQAKLADANAKLANADFGKFERELRDSNRNWLIGWGVFFLAIVAVVGGILWFYLKTKTNQLIADEVEKNLNEFKDVLQDFGILKDQLGELEEAVVVTMLERTFEPDLGSELGYPEENTARREEVLKGFPEASLLKVFGNEKYPLALRHRAAEVLARKSPPSVSPLLESLNSVIDSDSDIDVETGNTLRGFVGLLGQIDTQETYQELTKFLNRLLTEDTKHKDLFLTWTVFSLALVSIKLNIRDSVSTLRRAIPHLSNLQGEHQALKNLARYFDIFKEPEGIKEILTNHVTSEASDMEDVEARCLELLQKHDPEFVTEWRASETTENST